MIKLEIVGHIVQMFSKKCLNVHGVREFECKKDEDSCLV